MVKNLLLCRKPGSIPGSGRFPWRKERPPTLVVLPGEFHGQRSLMDTSTPGFPVLHYLPEFA